MMKDVVIYLLLLFENENALQDVLRSAMRFLEGVFGPAFELVSVAVGFHSCGLNLLK